MLKKLIVVSIIICCAFVWAQKFNKLEEIEMIPIIASETNNGIHIQEKNSGLYHAPCVSPEEGIERLIEERASLNEKLNHYDERTADRLVSDPPRIPHAHSCLYKYGSSTIYCACEATYSGYPAIYVYRSTNNGYTWSIVGGWYYSSSTYTACYPSIAVIHDYVVVTYDRRENNNLSSLRCARAAIGSSTFSFYEVDSDGRGMSDLCWIGGLNTVGCVYNYRYGSTDYDIEFRISYNGGETWGSRETVWGAWPNSAYLFRPKIWDDILTGQLHVAFVDLENQYLHYSKSTNEGSDWSTIYFTSPLEIYPDICSYGSYVLIPCRDATDNRLHFVRTTNGGGNWYYYNTNRLTLYPECIEQSGYWCVAYARSPNAYYTASYHTSYPSIFGQIDDSGVSVISDVVGICRHYEDEANVSWTDTRNGQTIWGEFRAIPGINETSEYDVKALSLQNSPNPFIDKTIIHYSVPVRSNVQLIIYNVVGEKIRVLTNEQHDPGNYSLAWYRRDDKEQVVPAGIYLCRLEAKRYKETIKITLVK